ncbi:MAG TPA: AMP-binding protein, partial [Jatrophihabitans sp.]|nr:AMP-binding protein [Jatrophihabitans sp.]
MTADLLPGDLLGRLDGLPAGSRVLTRLPSDRSLARLLLALYDRHLVAVPVDPRLPGAEADRLADRVGAALTVSRGAAGLDLSDGEPADAAEGAELAFVMFTSGSTGTPKGVTLSRTAVELNADWVARLHGFGPDRPHGTCLPLYHVNALMMSLLGTRRAGGELVLAPSAPQAYFAELARHGVRTASIVPALLHRLVEDGPDWPDSLDYLITAAAPLSSDLAARFARRYGPRLRQGYGLSEAVNFSFTMPLLDAEAFQAEYLEQVPPVGVPVGDTELRLLDGEVLLRTPARTHGYWRDPEATARLLDADGWLHTGDLGELRGDYLVLTGRRSEVINRG